MEPGFHLAYTALAHLYLARSQPEDAIAAFQKGVSVSGRDPTFVAELAAAYAQYGNRSQAEELQKEVLASYFPPALEIAGIYANLGDPDRAFYWLEVACSERQGNTVWIRQRGTRGPLRPLRSDPRWVALLKRLNLKP